MTKSIGFISPPNWFDPAPCEFPNIVEEKIVTQQAPILSPKFDYSFEAIASSLDDLQLCGESLKGAGCDLIAQVGSPFSWALVKSEDEARARCEMLARNIGVRVVMTGLAMIDALRAYKVKKIALNCTYYDPLWCERFAAFMVMCGFEVVHVSNLAQQGLVDKALRFEELGWSMTDDLTRKSIIKVAERAENAEAIVVTGAGTRTLNILSDLEKRVGLQIVAADTSLYWAIAKELSLNLKPEIGMLAKLS